MATVLDNGLIPEQLAYFRARYENFDGDELAELANRRGTLSDEAAAALDDVLTSRGISLFALTAFSTEAKAEATEAPLEDQVAIGRKLWASWPSKTAQFMTMGSFAGMAKFPANLVPHFGSSPGEALLTSVLVGFIAVGMAYGGYRLGRSITRGICANGDKSVEQRRKELLWFAVSILPAYILLYLLLSLVFSG